MMILYLLLLPLVFLLHYFFFRQPHHLPPGPNPWQFFRTLYEFQYKPHVAFQHLAKIYGPLMSFRLGGQLVVVASSSAVAKEVLKTHDRILSGRYLPSACYQVPGAMSAITMSRECNDYWKYLRSISHQCIFSSKAIDSKGRIRQEKIGVMVECLVQKSGETVKLDDVISVTVFNILTSILASRDLMDVRTREEIRTLMDEIGELAAAPGLSDLVPVLKRFDFRSKANGVTMHRKMMRVWGEVVRERRRGRTGAVSDYLDVLVQNGFLDDMISVILTELLIAGTDSTITTIVWLMVELIRNPEILSRVRKELLQAVDGNGTVFNELRLSACEYFQACIKETLRLHIPGPFLVPHRAVEACRVMDRYIVPKDSIVLVNAWAIQQDPENWDDASNFRPDRFLGSKIEVVGHDFEFLAFSAGRRMCPGYNLGFRNVQLVVACLVHNFDWSLPGGETPESLDIDERFGTTLKREKPLHLIPRIRGRLFV